MSEEPKLRELIVRAASDDEFAHQLLTSPESVASDYRLTTLQINSIRDLVGQGLFTPAVEAHSSAESYE